MVEYWYNIFDIHLTLGLLRAQELRMWTPHIHHISAHIKSVSGLLVFHHLFKKLISYFDFVI